MTVLFFSQYFFPHIGGVEKHALEIAKRISREGHRVIVITQSEKNDKKEKIYGIEIHRLYFGENNWFRKFRIWEKIFGKRRLIEKADIIHFHDVFFWFLPLMFLFPRKKTFITFHGFENIPPTNKEIIIRKLSEKLSSGNICVGDYIKKWYGTKPDFVTYGGVSKVKDAGYKRRGSKLKILMVGRLEEGVGVKTYLKVLKLLKGRFELNVCGDGRFRNDFSKFGKLNGFVKNLDYFLQKSDIVFASSYLSIMEAMRHRKLVFATYESKLKEDYLKMAPFSKFIIIEKSPNLLANKVKLITRDKNKSNLMKEEAFDWVKNQTWDRVVNQYKKLWGLN